MSLWGSNPTNAVPGIGGKFGVFAYLTAQADTTITTAETWYPIEGTFSNSPFENFVAATVNPPGIKYNHNITQYFIVAGQLTFSSSALTSPTVTVTLKKNGSIVPACEMSLYTKNANQKYSLAGSYVLELEEGDEIQMVMTSDTDGNVVTVYQFLLSIMRFFG